MPEQAKEQLADNNRVKLSAATARNAFPNITPGPNAYQFRFGVDWMAYNDGSVLSSHPNSDLWLQPPAKAREIKWSYGIFSGAYEREGDKTDGVEFIVLGELPDGSIHPADVAALLQAGVRIRRHGFPAPALMDRTKRKKMKKVK